MSLALTPVCQDIELIAETELYLTVSLKIPDDVIFSVEMILRYFTAGFALFGKTNLL